MAAPLLSTIRCGENSIRKVLVHLVLAQRAVQVARTFPSPRASRGRACSRGIPVTQSRRSPVASRNTGQLCDAGPITTTPSSSARGAAWLLQWSQIIKPWSRDNRIGAPQFPHVIGNSIGDVAAAVQVFYTNNPMHNASRYMRCGCCRHGRFRNSRRRGGRCGGGLTVLRAGCGCR